jgi:hypothetical protein
MERDSRVEASDAEDNREKNETSKYRRAKEEEIMEMVSAIEERV